MPPEPSAEVMDAAIARLLKSAGQAMVGDPQAAMEDVVRRGDG